MFYENKVEETVGFYQPPKGHITKKKNKKRKGRKNHFQKSNNFADKRTVLGFPTTIMSSWAESFTIAATWQLKHQVAFWKARAKALEYENKILHSLIRDNHSIPQSVVENDIKSDSEVEDNANQQEDDSLEVSEEFIEFLKRNARYKEDARRERELLKAKREANTIQENNLVPSVSIDDKPIQLKHLYGDKWQKISALEIFLHSQFIHQTDKEKPMYWPNIPFNFSFS